MLRSYTRSARLVLVLLIFAGFQLLFTLYLRMGSPAPAEPAAEKVEEFNPELFKVMSFGQLPAIIDWMWIKTLQDPFIAHVARGTHPSIFYTLDLVTDLDPAFAGAYTAGATLVSVVRDDGPGALHLVLKGEKFLHEELPKYPEEFKELYWTPQWPLPMLLAYIYLFDMEDMPNAVQAFGEASKMPGCPSYVELLMKQFEEPYGRYKVGLRLLAHMAVGTKDTEVRDRLNQKRHWLEVNLFLYQANERLQNFRKSRHYKKIDGQRLWSDFLSLNHESTTDPWGGRLSLNDEGKIMTTTSHQKVLGLE